jgi:uncharacterized protein (TIGR02271 family)
MSSSSSADQQPPQPSSPINDTASIIGKRVKTADYQHAGKVVTALDNEDAIIISSEGAHASYNYRVPKSSIERVDGADLLLSISRTELANYEIDDIRNHAAQLKSIKREKGGQEMIVPVIAEKLKVSKKVITEDATIIKEPVTETKILDISLMHEEIVLEKRQVAEKGNTTTTSESPPPKNTKTEIRIPVIREEVKVKKEPYVKEEIVIGKKPITETKTVSEFVISEKVDTGSDNNNTIAQTS